MSRKSSETRPRKNTLKCADESEEGIDTFPMKTDRSTLLGEYNSQMLTCIEDLCTKRDELQKQILSEEEEKTKIQNDIRILTERLAKINESLARKIASRNEYDKTIAETEAAYMKILESSQTLLHVLKNETAKDKSPLGRSQTTLREKSRDQTS